MGLELGLEPALGLGPRLGSGLGLGHWQSQEPTVPPRFNFDLPPAVDRMFDIILYSPQIPPNTGNIIRLCANIGARLHLIRPLGFDLDMKAVRRAGLDYHEMARVETYDSLADCLAALAPPALFAVTKFASQSYITPRYQAGTAFLFGAETTGLPDEIHDMLEDKQKIHLPMCAGNRSLNLSNAASIVLYEAWRQCGFEGHDPVAHMSQPEESQ